MTTGSHHMQALAPSALVWGRIKARPREAFNANCAECHGQDGQAALRIPWLMVDDG